jgi:hypothetical protein
MQLILCADRWWQPEQGTRTYRTTLSLATE